MNPKTELYTFKWKPKAFIKCAIRVFRFIFRWTNNLYSQSYSIFHVFDVLLTLYISMSEIILGEAWLCQINLFNKNR